MGEFAYEKIIIIFIWLIIWLAFPVCGYLGWRYYIKSKNEERKLLIEHGTNPDKILKSRKSFRFPWLKIGIVIIALGIGFFIITMLINFGWIGHSDAIFPAIFCVCGGLGLVVANYVDNRKKPE